jgi:hypothetical protein
MTSEELDDIINDRKSWAVTEFNNPEGFHNTERLKAAAPDLLEACIKLYNNWLAHDEILVGRESTQFARDAIYKATGVKPKEVV